MLTSLSLTNFKAWKVIENMRLAPITGLFGTNSSGKSSILQFLLMLKQTSASADQGLVLHLGDDKSLVSLGTFSDVIHKHDVESTISMEIRWTLERPLDIKNPDTRKSLFSSDQMGFKAVVRGNSGGKLTVDSLQYALGSDTFTIARKADKNEYDLSTSATGFKFLRTPGRAWPLPPPIKFYGFADEVRSYYQNAGFLSQLDLEFEKMLRGVYYLGPLREHPKREYTWAGGDPRDMGQRGEYAIAAILASLERGDKISRGKGKPKFTLEKYVAYWLKRLGLIHGFRVEEISKGTNLYRVHVRKSLGAPEVRITDVGFGVSQILPVLVLCYYAPEGSTILLEQPEIHLHPRVQSGLADVFIDAMRVRKVQIIIESHSEHFLRRLQRRIAEANDLTQEDTSLYFCGTDSGGPTITQLEMNMYGSIQNWPKDFFGDEMEDIAATNQAARQRRKQEEV